VANLPTLAITFVAGVLAATISGYGSPRMLLLPVMLLWLLAVVGAGALVLSALTVRAHDLLSALPFLLQILTFVSPVGYPSSALPHALQTIVAINPLTGLMETWRWTLLGVHVETLPLLLAIGETVLFVPLAWRLFAKLEAVMADEI
jgi:lipopolysaccharide transport system permease protein